MGPFLTALEHVQAHVGEHLDDNVSYLLAAERRREAEAVEPCAERFAIGEMDSEEELTVVRGSAFGPLGAPPSLAAKLGDNLNGKDRQTTDAVELAVHKALAVGYVSIVETEERAGVKLRSERTTEDLWEYWMTECRVMLEDTGIPKTWAKTVRGMGGDLLVADLKKLKVARFLGGSKVNQLGLMYAQAGAHLRMAQTDNTPDDLFRERVQMRRETPDRPWHLDDAVPT